MESREIPPAPRSVTSIWPPVVLLVFAVAVLWIAWGYSATAARFPVMVAVAMIVLVILDIWSRTGLPGSGAVEAWGGTGFRRREMTHDPTLAEQAECVGWMVAAFALMAAVGILAASPIFAAAYVRLRGKRTLAVAGAVGLGVLAFQVGVFEWALDYELYRGLLFTDRGLAAW